MLRISACIRIRANVVKISDPHPQNFHADFADFYTRGGLKKTKKIFPYLLRILCILLVFRAALTFFPGLGQAKPYPPFFPTPFQNFPTSNFMNLRL